MALPPRSRRPVRRRLQRIATDRERAADVGASGQGGLLDEARNGGRTTVAGALRSRASRRCVPKLELGNEGEKRFLSVFGIGILPNAGGTGGSTYAFRPTGGHYRGHFFLGLVLATVVVGCSEARDGSPPLAVAPFDAEQAREHQEAWAEHLGLPLEKTNSIGMRLVLIPPGEFMMGSPESERGHRDNEGPQHRVRITRPFYLGVHEVTVGQFAQFVADTGAQVYGRGDIGWNEATRAFTQDRKYSWQNPGFAQDADHPVVMASWNDAMDFCRWLSEKEGQDYRLPTEAEWEYACRAGTTTRFHHGDDPEGLARVGNIADETLAEKFPRSSIAARDGYAYTAPVGTFEANAFGLYDMHGNVREWCMDWFREDYYAKSPLEDPPGPGAASYCVKRGGSWSCHDWNCRSAYRFMGLPTVGECQTGFRVVLVPAEQSGP